MEWSVKGQNTGSGVSKNGDHSRRMAIRVYCTAADNFCALPAQKSVVCSSVPLSSSISVHSGNKRKKKVVSVVNRPPKIKEIKK